MFSLICAWAKKARRRWYETPSRSLWRQRNELVWWLGRIACVSNITPGLATTVYDNFIYCASMYIRTIQLWIIQSDLEYPTCEVKVQGHTDSPTSHRLTSVFFHVNRPPIPEIPLCKIHTWKAKVKVMGEVKFEDHIKVPEPYRLTSFRSMSIGHRISEIRLFGKLILKSQR